MLMGLFSISRQVMEKIAEMAADEMLLTVESVRKRMIDAQLRYENGETTEEEYREDMDYLRKRLRDLKSGEERA